MSLFSLGITELATDRRVSALNEQTTAVEFQRNWQTTTGKQNNKKHIPIEGFKKILEQRKQKQHAFKDGRALLRRTALFVALLRRK